MVYDNMNSDYGSGSSSNDSVSIYFLTKCGCLKFFRLSSRVNHVLFCSISDYLPSFELLFLLFVLTACQFLSNITLFMKKMRFTLI